MKRWTEDEIEKLKQVYTHTPNEELMEMFPKFNLKQIRYKARSFKLEKLPEVKKIDKDYNINKMLGERRWTEEDTEIMKNNYELMGIVGIHKLLPDKTRSSIGSKAIRMGLSTDLKAKWEMTEVKRNEKDVFSINVTFERVDR